MKNIKIICIVFSIIAIQIHAEYLEIQAFENKGQYSSVLSLSKHLQSSGDHIQEVSFSFKAESEHQADIRFNDQNNENRFSMPKIKPMDTLYKDSNEPGVEDTLFTFIKHEDSKKAFNFKIIRKSTKEIVFSGDQSMVFSENYLKYSSIIPSNDIFGIGERNNLNFKLKNGLYTMNGVDQLFTIEDARSGGQGVYGSHPVYLIREQSGNYHIVFYKNPTPSDCIIEDKKITFKSVGGIIHFKIFFGDKNPETAVRRFHDYLGGGHAIPPFWAFGFHQSRWGYGNDQVIYSLIDRHVKNDIPLDTVWSDIDFMQNKQTFTVDSKNFPESFFKKLHEDIKINYVPIVDCGVGAHDYERDNLALKKGIEMDIFLRSPITGRRFKGNVWPGDSFFPDFLHPNCTDYWSFMMADLHKKTNFTGMWLDMNEPSNFDCHKQANECTWQDTNPQNEVKLEYIRPRFDLPYKPGNKDIEFMTLPSNLVHYGNYTHKDVHNLYGLMDTYLTFQALKNLNKTYPFILTRSSFTGAGRYTFKWTGDNVSNFDYLRISIPSLLHFNIFGIPFIGADICGFMRDSWDELCQRWIQLGALYPFARNHNNNQPRSQEFFSFSQEVLLTSVKNLKLRYSLLKHYFMLFIRTNHRGTVFRPVFFEFPSDNNCLDDSVLNGQFLLGKELMATPVLQEGQTTVNAYFPDGLWFDLLSGYKMKDTKKGQFKEVYNTLTDYVPIYIRSGKIVGLQSTKNVLKTADLNNEFNLICSLKQAGSDQFTCSGNMLNLNNQLDEKEVQESCDQEFNSHANCVLKVTISLNSKEKILSFEVQSHQDPLWKPINHSKLKLKDITIKTIVMYNFPSIQISQDEVKIKKEDGSLVEDGIFIKKYNYSYNKYIVFEKNQVILSNISKFTLKL